MYRYVYHEQIYMFTMWERKKKGGKKLRGTWKKVGVHGRGVVRVHKVNTAAGRSFSLRGT